MGRRRWKVHSPCLQQIAPIEMKPFIKAAMLLLSLSILLSSCNKGSTSSIVGLWVRTDYEVYANGEKGEKNEWTDEYFNYAPGSVQFNNDGSGILASIVHFTYKQNGNNITLSAPGTGANGIVIEKDGNRLIFIQGIKSMINPDSDVVVESHLKVFYEKQ